MKKHGIYIIEGKKFNTKKIYNNGFLLIEYLFQPKQIFFKNDMVNDINQHFAGGWSIDGIDLSDKSLLLRVVNRCKPMGVIGKNNKMELLPYFNLLEGENKMKQKNITLIYDVIEVSSLNRHYFYLSFAQEGKMECLFDLKTLEKDYLNAGIKIDTSKVVNKTLKDYFKDWNAQRKESKIEFWETGLILGYPIENTISFYLGGIR